MTTVVLIKAAVLLNFAFFSSPNLVGHSGFSRTDDSLPLNFWFSASFWPISTFLLRSQVAYLTLISDWYAFNLLPHSTSSSSSYSLFLWLLWKFAFNIVVKSFQCCINCPLVNWTITFQQNQPDLRIFKGVRSFQRMNSSIFCYSHPSSNWFGLQSATITS